MNFEYKIEKRIDTNKIVRSVSTRVPINGVKTRFVYAYDGDFDAQKESDCRSNIIADIEKARDGR